MSGHAAFAEQDGTDLGSLIADTASGLFAEAGPIGNDAARACADEGTWFGQGWAMLAEAGFPQAMRSEQEGGIGSGPAITIARLSGAAALALPLADAMGADWLLSQAGLPPAEAPVVFAPELLQFSAVTDGVRVTGKLNAVPWGRKCDLVCTGLLDGKPVLTIIPQASLMVTPGANMADEPRDRVIIDTVVANDAIAPLPTGFREDTPQLLGAALRAAQIAGAVEAAVDMTVTYARERKQFGRSLTGFQAVQQLLAVIATEAAAARMASDLAAASLATGLDPQVIATAKIRAGEAAGKVARTAHQIHGAIGFTREYLLQLLTRRLWSWRDECGSEAEWSIALARSLAANDEGLWAAVTGIGQ